MMSELAMKIADDNSITVDYSNRINYANECRITQSIKNLGGGRIKKGAESRTKDSSCAVSPNFLSQVCTALYRVESTRLTFDYMFSGQKMASAEFHNSGVSYTS